MKNNNISIEVKNIIKEEKIKKEWLEYTIDNICIKNINFEDYKSKNEFEVIKFLKDKKGNWIEEKRFMSGSNWYIIKDKLYTKVESQKNILFVAPMNFDSEINGACYQYRL